MKEGKHTIMTPLQKVLHKYGHKLTPQRYMILSVLQEAREHLCLEQVVQHVQKRNPQVSQTTVYRTLALLQELGLIRQVHFPGKPLYYEIILEREHHHFLCTRCQATRHLDSHLLTHLFEQLQTQYHIHDLTLGLLATGYCDACWLMVQQEEEMQALE